MLENTCQTVMRDADMPWSEAIKAPFRDGVVHFTLKDIAAPRARLALAKWPPVGGAE